MTKFNKVFNIMMAIGRAIVIVFFAVNGVIEFAYDNLCGGEWLFTLICVIGIALYLIKATVNEVARIITG